MFIKRLKAFFSFLILLMIGMISFYFSIKEVIGYYNFDDVIIYSWLDFFSLLFSFFILILSIYPSHVAFYGKALPAEKASGIYKISILLFVISLVVPIAFSFFYINEIESKGYIKCHGMPSGWMPGMATKYVTNEALCLKKDP